MPPSGQIDEVGRWALQKLEVLGKYLNAYTTIMKEQNRWCQGYHYIDAFAGSGRPRLKDEERFIDGSPRIALGIKYPFTSYIFIELEPWRVQQLDALRGEFLGASIQVLQGDCNDLLTTVITPTITFDSFQRGVIFLDPFRMNLEWTTIEAIAATRALEVFINVPTMSMNREVLSNDPTALTAAKVDLMNRFWGSPDWRESIYEERTNLFGEVEEFKIRPTRARHLGNLYRERLLTVFPYVSRSVVVRNSTGQPIYCLVFAGPNERGKNIVNDLLRGMES